MTTYIRKIWCKDPANGKNSYNDIEIELDIEALANDLGKRAVQSKGGRSVACGGAIKAKVIARDTTVFR